MDNFRNLLDAKIQGQISWYDKSRVKNKRLAAGFRVSIVLLTASAAILIGIDASSETKRILNNLALIASMLASGLGALEAYFDHRSVWIKYANVSSKLKTLHLSLQKASNCNDEAELNEIESRLASILDSAALQWSELRHSDEKPSLRR